MTLIAKCRNQQIIIFDSTSKQTQNVTIGFMLVRQYAEKMTKESGVKITRSRENAQRIVAMIHYNSEYFAVKWH